MINDVCSYEWSATFVSPTGTACRIADQSLVVVNNEIRLVIVQDSCPTIFPPPPSPLEWATIYLIQSVSGDAAGGNAEYTLTETCGSLPDGRRGIAELLEGRFNATAVLGNANGVAVIAVDENGVACTATVSILGLPSHCSSLASYSRSLASGRDSNDRVFFEFQIDCTTLDPTPPPPQPGPRELVIVAPLPVREWRPGWR